MSTKYLLPCRCGQQIIVEPREAGETAVCPCGQSLPIPAMLEMAALEPAPIETSPAPSAPVWGWEHGLLLLGVALLAVAIGLAVWFRWTRPIAPSDTIDPERIRQIAGSLTPPQTWHYWELMRQGLDRRVDQKYAGEMTIYHWKQGFAGILALAGIGLIGVGVVMKPKKRGGRKEEAAQAETPKT